MGILFEWWNLRMGNTKQYDEPSMIKQIYGSALYNKITKSKELKRRKDLESKDRICPFWRILQFTDETDITTDMEIGDTDWNTSITDPDGTLFDPGDKYAETVLNEEFQEVILGNQKWQITITAFGKDRTELWNYTYDYAREGFGSGKLLVYVNSNRAKNIGGHLGKKIKNLDVRNLNTHCPIDPSKHEMFREEFSDARNLNTKFTRQDTFCPGFILEVDNCFNVFVTRLSMAQLFYGHHGVQNQWQKLERMTDDKRYLDSMESQDGVKQMVFSYRKFIHTSRVYENWLETGKPEISLVDSKVLMPVDNVPSLHKGCDSGCDFFFEIEHKPARKIYKRIRRREEQNPPSIFISDPKDDLLSESFKKIALTDEPRIVQPVWTTWPLPQGWEKRFDNNSRRHHFVNHHTQQSQWDDPRISVYEEEQREAKAIEESAIDHALRDLGDDFLFNEIMCIPEIMCTP
ncbi:uncharacterized protein LOC134814807 [Bolinopsis microptera]|uniref:uncharacterized protein LOC134814807 n=1 Tax=Bolinopsis microptera TaxID=2820187 RepID=UPI00307AE44D